MTTVPMTATSNTAAGVNPIMHRLSACLAGAAALLVSASVLGPPSAQARPIFPLAPICDGQYEFNGSSFTIISNKHKDNTVRFQASRQKVGPEAEESYVTEETYGGLDAGGLNLVSGNASGGIKGLDIIDITVTWTSGAQAGKTSRYTGRVGEDGYASGDGWRSTDALSCVEAFVPGPVPPPPPPPPPPRPVEPPVTDAIGLSFGPPDASSITATVTNSSALTAKCTYDATATPQPLIPIPTTHRDFTVGPNGNTPLTFTGIALGINYHVKVSCHDASGKQTQVIGRVEQDVRF